MALSRYGKADKVYDDGTGLLSITRRYKVDGQYTTVDQLPTDVRLDYETADEEHSDCLLAYQAVKGREGQDPQESYLTRVYLQIPADAATLVQIGNDLVTYSENGLKLVEQRFFAKRTHALIGTVGTTTGETDDQEPDYNANISGLILSSNGFGERGKVSAVVVKRWSESGILSDNSDSKYGGQLDVRTVTALGMTESDIQTALSITDDPLDTSINNVGGYKTYTYRFISGSGVISTTFTTKGVLTTTAIVSINEAPTSPPGSVLVDAKTDVRDFGVIYTYRYVSGEGEISRSTDTRYNGALTVTTISSIGDVPDSTGAIIKAESTVRDGYIVYTYQFADGQGQISSSTDSQYNGALTVTRVTSINEVPTGSGTVIDTKVDAKDGYTLYSYAFATGSGEIATSSEERYNGALTITTKTSIETPPEGSGVVVSTSQKAKDGYMIFTYKFAEGSGQISTSTDSRSDGSSLVTTSSLGVEPTGPGGDYLEISTATSERDGFILYRTSWYSPPDSYTAPVAMSVSMPAEIIHDSAMGPKLSSNAGGPKSVIGTVSVDFSLSPPEAAMIKTLAPVTIVEESYTVKDGGDKIRNQIVFRNSATSASTVSTMNAEYKGEETSIAVITYSGPSYSEYAGTVLTGWVTEPYFSAGGVRVWKTSTTEVTL